MSASKAAINSQTQVWMTVPALDADNLVSDIESATTDALKWAAVYGFVGNSDVHRIGQDIEELPPLRGEPNNIERFVYNGRTQGESKPGPRSAQSLTFTIASFDRTDPLHKALEDADVGGGALYVSLLTVTNSDGEGKTPKEITTPGAPGTPQVPADATAEATARAVYGRLNSARLMNGPGDQDQSMEVVIGVSSVSPAVDQE